MWARAWYRSKGAKRRALLEDARKGARPADH